MLIGFRGIRGIRGVTFRPRNFFRISARLLLPNTKFGAGADKIIDTIKRHPRPSVSQFEAEQLSETLSWSDMQYVNLSRTHMSHDSLAKVASGLGENGRVLQLNMSNCGLTDTDIHVLVDALHKNKHLEVLNLDGNKDLTYEGIGYIADLIGQQENLYIPKIQVLNLSDIDIGNDGLSLILGRLAHNTHIQRLYLESCGITNDGVEVILNHIRDLKITADIRLKGNDISIANRCAIFAAVKKNAFERDQNIVWNIGQYDLERIDAEGMKHILSVIAQQKNIISLLIDQKVKIDPEAISVLADFLKTNNTLLGVGIGYHDIGVKAIQALGEAISQNTTLIGLDLSCIQINDENMQYLASALKNHPSITHLNLVANDIGDKAAKTLASALDGNKTIREIDLSLSKNVTQEGWEAMRDLVANNPNIAIRASTLALDIQSHTSDIQGEVNSISHANRQKMKGCDSMCGQALKAVGTAAALSSLPLIASTFMPSYASTAMIVAGLIGSALVAYYFTESNKGEIEKT